jgi:hypothetical protein
VTSLKHSYDKRRWRLRTIDCLQSHPELWVKSGGKRILKYTYVDLFGDSGLSAFELFKPHLQVVDGMYPQYVAIERDASVVARSIFLEKNKGRDLPFRLYFGNAYHDIALLFQKGEKIGCVMLDTTHGLNKTWWSENRSKIRDIVDEGVKVCPMFVLCMNHTLTRGGDRGVSLIERVRMHVRNLVQTFEDWKLTRTDLLSEKDETIIQRINEVIPSPFYPKESPGKEREEQFAPVGGFDIYRSADRILTMITVRIAFDSSRQCARVYICEPKGSM